jgi:hypothetical protein
LNVAPLLHPALQSAWEKTRGKKYPRAGITLNKSVTHDLLWFADMFQRSHTVHVLSARDWVPQDANLALYTDASATGLGFWCPLHWKGFISELPPPPIGLDNTFRIFWYEALTVASALDYATSLNPTPARLVIFTDNLNTVQIFESLRAHGPYNSLLLFAIQHLIAHHIDLRVLHVTSDLNVVADALSRNLFSTVLQYAPKLHIQPFTPPRDALGAPCSC